MSDYEMLLKLQKFIKILLPKINWGDSFFDAEVITMLNEIPKELDEHIRDRD